MVTGGTQGGDVGKLAGSYSNCPEVNIASHPSAAITPVNTHTFFLNIFTCAPPSALIGTRPFLRLEFEQPQEQG